MHSFIYLFVHSLIHSFICLFVYLFWHSRDMTLKNKNRLASLEEHARCPWSEYSYVLFYPSFLDCSIPFPFSNVFSLSYSAADIWLSQPLSESATARNPILEVRHRVHLQLETREVLRVALSFRLRLKWPPLSKMYLQSSQRYSTLLFPLSPLSPLRSLDIH